MTQLMASFDPDFVPGVSNGWRGGAQDIEQIDSSSLQGGDRGRLILLNGLLLIIRGDHTYTITGQRVE